MSLPQRQVKAFRIVLDLVILSLLLSESFTGLTQVLTTLALCSSACRKAKKMIDGDLLQLRLE